MSVIIQLSRSDLLIIHTAYAHLVWPGIREIKLLYMSSSALKLQDTQQRGIFTLLLLLYQKDVVSSFNKSM